MEVHKMFTPDEAYPELFVAVQGSALYPDSKTFVDLEPLYDAAFINSEYSRLSIDEGFELRQFVEAHFRKEPLTDVTATREKDICQHIRSLWPVLSRQPEVLSDYSSRLPLNHAYVVPGGRFNEIYYWDSYFTQLGLAAQGELELLRSMVDNFADMIASLGFIPNGNRTYFCTRSQPPFFALMVELLVEQGDEGAYQRYFNALQREYAFWMAGAAELDPDSAHRRVVNTSKGVLNRYWDEVDTPRQESYKEDIELVYESGRHAAELYRDLRAGAESGWDFSSRWCTGDSLGSIRTTEILPVDLNVLLYLLESTLMRAADTTGQAEMAGVYERAAQKRATLIQNIFFDAEGYFADLDSKKLTSTGKLSLATLFPLFAGVASAEQAKSVAVQVEQHLLRQGGWVTTEIHSGQQWDAPNGWAPLQWIAFVGLKRYGFVDLAELAAKRWLHTNELIFNLHGKMIEKYNVEQPEQLSGGGEYVVQDGFGWSNGVYLALRQALGLDI